MILQDVLDQVVAKQRGPFRTKDIACDVRMRRAHPGLTSARNYFAFVGRALAQHPKLKRLGPANRHGVKWLLA